MRLKSLVGIAVLAFAAPVHAQDRGAGPGGSEHGMPMPAAAATDHDMTAMHAHDDTVAPKHPMLLTGYGSGGFAITTAVPQAQAFFSNGMELGAAFAHPAAVAAMKEAVRLDPDCAMCKWGEALVDGPTINFGKDAKERTSLYDLARTAQMQAAKNGTAREQALIAALVVRYRPGKPVEKRDIAYTKAMRAVQASYPEDNEIAVLTADAILVTATHGDDPDMAQAQTAVDLLEPVLRRDPDHTPAIHFYIHATEIVDHPRLAERYADRLAALAPNASHLIHMPSHTFYWAGRYQDAADANRRAVEIGIEQARMLGVDAPKGVWGLPYHAHNVVFGLGGALMSGDSRTALELARPLVETTQAMTEGDPVRQLLAASGYFALARFDPAAALTTPEPKLPYLAAAWHYARGEALAWSGDIAGAKAELAKIPDHIAKDKVPTETKAAKQMLAIARGVLAGRIAMAEARPADAAKDFAAAADVEETKDFSRFSDPPAFWYPVRRDVAAALLAAGDASGAVKAAQASLTVRPRDPVAMDLLARSQASLAAK